MCVRVCILLMYSVNKWAPPYSPATSLTTSSKMSDDTKSVLHFESYAQPILWNNINLDRGWTSFFMFRSSVLFSHRSLFFFFSLQTRRIVRSSGRFDTFFFATKKVLNFRGAIIVAKCVVFFCLAPTSCFFSLVKVVISASTWSSPHTHTHTKIKTEKNVGLKKK